jgi:hypothetical protein
VARSDGRPRKASRSVARHRARHRSSVLPLQRPLQEGRSIELVGGGRIGNVDDVDREATRDAVVRQMGREVAGIGFGVGPAQSLLLLGEARGIDQRVGGYTKCPS